MKEKTVTVLDIPASTNYWIIRASGGRYAMDFKVNNRVTLNSENININLVSPKFKKFRAKFEEHKIKESINKKEDSYPSQQSITIAAKKVFNFVHVMKIGDIVLVPTYKSLSFMVGVVTSKVKQYPEKKIELNDTHQGKTIDTSPDKFYREVYWLNDVSRNRIDSSLLYILTMHQSLIEIKENTFHIDKLISPLYLKEENLNLSLKVNKKEEISTEQWGKFYYHLNNTKKDNEKITVKTNVQSPGNIELTISIANLPDPIMLGIFLILTGQEVEIQGVTFKVKSLMYYIKEAISKRRNTKRKCSDSDNNDDNNNNDEQLKMPNLSEENKKDIRQLIHTLDLTAPDAKALVENTSKSNENDNEEEES